MRLTGLVATAMLLALATGQAPAAPATTATAGSDPASLVESLVPALSGTDAKARGLALHRLHAMGLRVSVPSAEAARAAFCRALADKLAPDAPSGLLMAALTILEEFGGEECVGPVAAFLTHDDRQVRQRALGALQTNTSPKAGAPLRQALGKATTTEARVEMIQACAYRHDAEATALIAPHLASGDASLAASAASALGHIGGEAALKLLAQARTGASPRLLAELNEACLECASELLSSGQKEQATATLAGIYTSRGDSRARVGALRLMVRAQGAGSVGILVEALGDADPTVQSAAIDAMREAPGKEATSAFAAALPKLPRSAQVALLSGLGRRGDVAAREAVSGMVQSTDPEVRIAATEALLGLGEATAIAPLVEAASAGDADRRERIRSALIRSRMAEMDPALIGLVAAGTPAARAEAMKCLELRMASPAAPALLKAAEDADSDVRLEAFRTLGALARRTEADALLKLIERMPEGRDEERSAAEVAAASACAQDEDRAGRLQSLQKAIEAAPELYRCSLIRVTGRLADQKCLAVLNALLDDKSPPVAEAAARAIIDWPAPPPNTPAYQPVAEGLKLAQSAPTPSLKVLALRSYLRMAGYSRGDGRLRMYEQALPLAQRAEEKRLILSKLPLSPGRPALAMAVSLLADKEVGEEAATATVNIAAQLPPSDGKEVRSAMDKVLAVAQVAATRDKAQKLLDAAAAGPPGK